MKCQLNLPKFMAFLIKFRQLKMRIVYASKISCCTCTSKKKSKKKTFKLLEEFLYIANSIQYLLMALNNILSMRTI